MDPFCDQGIFVFQEMDLKAKRQKKYKTALISGMWGNET